MNNLKDLNIEIKISERKFTRTKLKHAVNEKFFDNWNGQSAYLLGFTYADGNIYKTSLSWEIQKRDIALLKKIKRFLKCTYPITLGHKGLACRLRISNQVLVRSLLKLGLLPKKKFRYQIPKIPQIFLRHFIRGYLDGDGWMVIRNNRNEIDVGFAGINKEFLEVINSLLAKKLNIRAGKVRKKIKTTPKGVEAVCYQLEFYSSRAFTVAQWLYEDLGKDDLFLDRKYNKYIKAKKLHQFLISGGRKSREIQKTKGKSMEEILKELYLIKKLDGVEIAEVLEVHSSSIYRWLAQIGVKYSSKRSM